MIDFEDKDLIEQKALATSIVSELLPVHENLKKYCEKRILEIEQIEQKLTQASDFEKIDSYSKQSEIKREELIKFLAIKNRVQNIINKNNQRILFIKNQLDASGIYNEQTNKKNLEQIELQNIDNISEESLGLSGLDLGYTQKFIDGTIYVIKNNKLDFSIEENKQTLICATEDKIHKAISTFPESVSTIGADILVNYVIKRKVLKEITSFVYDEAKRQSFREINKSLGGLLNFRKEIPDNFETYIVGIQNMFNVLVKLYLKAQYPSKADEIEKNLKCNENSALIPEERIKPLISKINDNSKMEQFFATSDLEYDKEINLSNEDILEDVASDFDKSADDQDAIALLNALGIGVDNNQETE